MNAPHKPEVNWVELNQQWLTSQLACLRRQLDPDEAAETANPQTALQFEPALERCVALFGLSPFERDLLLLIAGVELDAKLRQAVIAANAHMVPPSRAFHPSFSLAIATLGNSHWDAISPQAPLRRWRLIELQSGDSPLLQPLQVDERILHFITGVPSFDTRLRGLVRLGAASPRTDPDALALRLARSLTEFESRAPLVVLAHPANDPVALAAAAEDVLGAALAHGLWIRARDLSSDPIQLADFAVRVDRECSLSGGIPVLELDAHAADLTEQENRATIMLSHLLSPVLLLGGGTERLARMPGRRIIRAAIDGSYSIGSIERTPGRVAEALRPALQQFLLSSARLDVVTEELAGEAASDEPDAVLEQHAWDACREAARGGLDGLAQRVESQVTFADLVLPTNQMQLLQEVAQHLRHRSTVYEEWGLSGKTVRGQGLCVLFVGESGTGKTLAAEAIANEARLDLYRIDLATVVSKYIGETEKNLKRLFDAADSSGAVLLFDEADALFGKRSDVKDSHDRYANIEVAYLLQRIEGYRGLAILTTNYRSALDRAFLRRIRFIVQFPFPDPAARKHIWQLELPDTAPLDAVDFDALARMQMSGGHIRTVALNAAFMAAADGEPVSMRQLRHAAQREAAKLERPLLELATGVRG